jgi:diguanylate cyclase (GGDEF)-like protein
LNSHATNKTDLTRLERELETLVEVGKALTSRLTLNDVFQVTMDKISSLLKPSAWALLVVDESTQTLRYEVVVSPVESELKGVILPFGEEIAGHVAMLGQPLLVEDVTQDERFFDRHERRFGFQILSVICVPLKAPGKNLGVIKLVNAVGHEKFRQADLRILSTIADFTAIAIENVRLLDKVRELTITDDLTGLFNSRHFQTLLNYEVERAERLKSEVSLVFIDIDRFKQVNDTYGHLTGSRLLSEIGKTIRSNTRIMNHAARYGGDEFVILLPGAGNDAALGMIDNLREAFSKGAYRSDGGHPIEVTASIGIATYPTNASNRQELVRLADMAMYAVKKAGRDGVKTAYDVLQGPQ